MQKMNPVVKAEWLNLLRSGEIPQGRDELRSSDGSYCCLGVLCESARKAGATDYWETDNGAYHVYGEREGYDYDEFAEAGSWSSLPKNVQEWAGLENNDPYVTVPTDHPKYETADIGSDGKQRVSVLNDLGFTFEEIADLIENEF